MTVSTHTHIYTLSARIHKSFRGKLAEIPTTFVASNLPLNYTNYSNGGPQMISGKRALEWTSQACTIYRNDLKGTSGEQSNPNSGERFVRR